MKISHFSISRSTSPSGRVVPTPKKKRTDRLHRTATDGPIKQRSIQSSSRSTSPRDAYRTSAPHQESITAAQREKRWDKVCRKNSVDKLFHSDDFITLRAEREDEDVLSVELTPTRPRGFVTEARLQTREREEGQVGVEVVLVPDAQAGSPVDNRVGGVREPRRCLRPRYIERSYTAEGGGRHMRRSPAWRVEPSTDQRTSRCALLSNHHLYWHMSIGPLPCHFGYWFQL